MDGPSDRPGRAHERAAIAEEPRRSVGLQDASDKIVKVHAESGITQPVEVRGKRIAALLCIQCPLAQAAATVKVRFVVGRPREDRSTEK
jgi:hypothetical protein